MTRWLLWLYKRLLSPVLHGVAGATGACRFQPTCSEYAALAIATYRAGTWGLACCPARAAVPSAVPGRI